MDLVLQSTAISELRYILARETPAVIPTLVDEAAKLVDHRETRPLRSSSTKVPTFDPKPNSPDS